MRWLESPQRNGAAFGTVLMVVVRRRNRQPDNQRKARLMSPRSPLMSPLPELHAQQPGAEVQAVPALQAGIRVLVVDDNRDAAEMLAMLLAMSGHTTQTAHDGPEALAMADAWQPQVILLDIWLPLMSGLDVARRLRLHAAGQHMVLVALTGGGQPSDRLATEAAGFDLHLVKPCNPGQLLQLLPGLLARRAAAPGAG